MITKNNLQDVILIVKSKIYHKGYVFSTETELTFAALLLITILFFADNKTYYTV